MNLNKDPHYKLYVQLGESIIFDAALKEAHIDFLKEENPLGEYIRYYFKDADSQKVDEINRNLELSISTETIPSLDYKISKKYLIIILIVIVLVWIITLF